MAEQLLVPFKLKDYVEKAQYNPVNILPGVPPMPPYGQKSRIGTLHKSNIKLGWRHLRGMERLEKTTLESHILRYYEQLPDRQVDPNPGKGHGDRLTVPAPGMVTLPPDPWVQGLMYDVATAFDVTKTASQTALKTAVTLLHQIDEKTRDWTFRQKETISEDVRPFDPWSFANWTVADDAQRDVRFAVVILAPWAFAPADFAEYINVSRLPDWSLESSFRGLKERNASTAELLWAMIYDFCYRNNCHHWVVSTYDQWAFGAFSENFRIGWTTDVYDLTSRGPNALQVLLYWLHSAFGGANTWELPQVEEDNIPVYYVPHTEADPSEDPPSRKRRAQAGWSEDEFSDSDDETDHKRFCHGKLPEYRSNVDSLSKCPTWDFSAFIRDYDPRIPGLVNRNTAEALSNNADWDFDGSIHDQPVVVPTRSAAASSSGAGASSPAGTASSTLDRKFVELWGGFMNHMNDFAHGNTISHMRFPNTSASDHPDSVTSTSFGTLSTPPFHNPDLEAAVRLNRDVARPLCSNNLVWNDVASRAEAGLDFTMHGSAEVHAINAATSELCMHTSSSPEVKDASKCAGVVPSIPLDLSGVDLSHLSWETICSLLLPSGTIDSPASSTEATSCTVTPEMQQNAPLYHVDVQTKPVSGVWPRFAPEGDLGPQQSTDFDWESIRVENCSPPCPDDPSPFGSDSSTPHDFFSDFEPSAESSPEEVVNHLLGSDDMFPYLPPAS